MRRSPNIWKKLQKKENTTQSEIIRKLIEEKYQEFLKKEKLKAFKSITIVEPGSLVWKSMQKIKEKIGKRYESFLDANKRAFHLYSVKVYNSQIISLLPVI